MTVTRWIFRNPKTGEILEWTTPKRVGAEIAPTTVRSVLDKGWERFTAGISKETVVPIHPEREAVLLIGDDVDDF
jgi:hypothetical protein